MYTVNRQWIIDWNELTKYSEIDTELGPFITDNVIEIGTEIK